MISQHTIRPLTLRSGVAHFALATVAFHLAYTIPALGSLVVLYLYSMLELSRVPKFKHAMNLGCALGILLYGPHLAFFLKLFGPGGVVLWIVLGVWLGLFLGVLGACRRQWGEKVALLLAPALWLGFEFLRSECYYLRFSWLSAGFVFVPSSSFSLFAGIGVYGLGFGLMIMVAVLHTLPPKAVRMIFAAAVLAVLLGATNLPVALHDRIPQKTVAVAGIQFEGFTDTQALAALNDLARKHPDADLYVLCEYAFDAPPSTELKAWCRAQGKYLIAGGKEPLPGNNYYNTAYVIGPAGEVVFKQAKKVPLPFFNDGTAAPTQEVWYSPWGKIGICICYDLSFARVTDELIRQGAQALIVPTMDAADWGKQQHQLHTFVARLRAAEYRVPIFRVASSGISQLVHQRGFELATAPFPGERETLAGTLEFRESGRLTWDRYIALPAALVAAALSLWFAGIAFWKWMVHTRKQLTQPVPQL